MIKNIYESLQEICLANKDRVFFVRQNRTYADLLVSVKKRAVLLSKKFNIKKGDTVALLSGNTPEFIQSFFAIMSRGARVLMLDTGLSKQDHLNMMIRTNCNLAFAQKQYFIDSEIQMFDIETLDDTDENEFESGNPEFDDLAILSFTSGSTGNPKVVGLTHGNLISAGIGAQKYNTVIRPGYMFYGFLPLYHIYGIIINIIAPIFYKDSLLLQPVLNPKEFMKDFKQYKPEIIPAVPRIWEAFYKNIIDAAKKNHKYTLMRVVLSVQGFLRFVGLGFIVKKVTKPIQDIFGGNAKLLISAGATLKPRVRKFYERLGLIVGDCYGLTETTGPANFNFEFRMENGLMSYGGALPGNQIKIHNPDKNGIGDVWTRGNLTMAGYVDNADANTEAFEDGWFKTGDIGIIDKKQRLTIKGRKKQVIVLDSGKNVYSDELEDLYMANDEVLMAAVLERTIKGKIVAYGVFQVKPGTTVEKMAMLIKVSNLRLAPYKWVKHFAITENELPQTSAKKIKHFELGAMLDRGEFPNNV